MYAPVRFHRCSRRVVSYCRVSPRGASNGPGVLWTYKSTEKDLEEMYTAGNRSTTRHRPEAILHPKNVLRDGSFFFLHRQEQTQTLPSPVSLTAR